MFSRTLPAHSERASLTLCTDREVMDTSRTHDLHITIRRRGFSSSRWGIGVQQLCTCFDWLRWTRSRFCCQFCHPLQYAIAMPSKRTRYTLQHEVAEHNDVDPSCRRKSRNIAVLPDASAVSAAEATVVTSFLKSSVFVAKSVSLLT